MRRTVTEIEPDEAVIDQFDDRIIEERFGSIHRHDADGLQSFLHGPQELTNDERAFVGKAMTITRFHARQFEPQRAEEPQCDRLTEFRSESFQFALKDFRRQGTKRLMRFENLIRNTISNFDEVEVPAEDNSLAGRGSSEAIQTTTNAMQTSRSLFRVGFVQDRTNSEILSGFDERSACFGSFKQQAFGNLKRSFSAVPTSGIAE